MGEGAAQAGGRTVRLRLAGIDRISYTHLGRDNKFAVKKHRGPTSHF